MKFLPKIHPYIQKFLDDKNRLFELIDSYGSPVGIIFPSLIKENIEKFQQIFKECKIKGSIYFAHKCNKSDSVIKTVKRENINVDVASVNELKHVLSNGFNGLNIMATGPKNDNFIILGLYHDILFNCDNLDELANIINFHKTINKKTKTKVLIRLNNFSSGENKFINKQSRFGISIESVTDILKIVVQNKDYIDLKGFSFHLDTINEKEKIIAIENILEIMNLSYSLDLNPDTIDIGGGFKINYIKDKESWNLAISELKNCILTNSSELWNNTSFGLGVDKGILTGNLNIADYYNEIAKQDSLDTILKTVSLKFQNRIIGEILSENMINLIIEPGKSLLDNAGITISNINYIKKSARGDSLIGINMNKSNLLLGDGEILVDPLLITKEINNQKCSAFLLGNLCLESDLLFKRKIEFNKIPSKNDLLVFINTAGYFMDFNESSPIMQNKVKKIIYSNNKIYLDECYEPLLHESI